MRVLSILLEILLNLFLWFCTLLGFYMLLLLLLSYFPEGPSAKLDWGPIHLGRLHNESI